MQRNQNIHIRPLTPADYDQWRVLAVGYRDFYKVPQSEESLQSLWQWLMDKDYVLEGYCVEMTGKLVALCHIRAMPRPLSGKEIGFWDDLYVAPEYRGHKITEKIIEFIRELARERGWAMVRWLTADTNYSARRIYDKYAEKTQFNLYQMKID